LITVKVSDNFTSSFTSTFLVRVTNEVPRVATVPADVSVVHGKVLSIPLASNFFDDDGDPITLAATYSLNGETAVKIPSGIFTLPSAFTLLVTSTSIT